MAETSETARYRVAWQDRGARFRAILAVLFAAGVMLFALPNAIAAIVGIVATLAVAWRYATFRCPRCDDEFLSVPDAVGVGWRSPLRETCQRCGLVDGADPPA